MPSPHHSHRQDAHRPEPGVEGLLNRTNGLEEPLESPEDKEAAFGWYENLLSGDESVDSENT